MVANIAFWAVSGRAIFRVYALADCCRMMFISDMIIMSADVAVGVDRAFAAI